MNIGDCMALEEVWSFINQQSYLNKCRYKTKYAPGVITIKCCQCKSFYRFIKNDYLYKLVAANVHHNHDETLGIIGEPVEESIKNYMYSLISGIKAKDFSYKYIEQMIFQKFGDNIEENRIRYIFQKFFIPDWLDEWRKIPPYIQKLNERGVTADIKFVEQNESKLIQYIYFEAPYSKSFVSSNVFPKILMMDGTFLKPLHTKGILLILSTVSPDHIALPLSGAIVDGETKEAYKYFLEKNKNIIPNIDDIEISIITDQHESILSALKTMFPTWKYSPCCFHLIQKYKEAQAAFFIMIKSTNIELYEARLNVFKSKYKTAYKAIKDYLPEITRVKNAPYRYNYVTDSVLEGINGSLSESRKYEPIFLIESFIKFCMDQWNKQIMELNIHNSLYVNRIEGILENMKRNNYNVKVDIPGERFHVLEAEDGHDFQYCVEILRNPRTLSIINIECSCNMMLETLHPCIHTIMVLKRFLYEIPQSIMGILHYREINKEVFKPIRVDLPDIASIIPDKSIDPTTFVKIRAGRPVSSKRFRGSWEKVYKKKRKCSKCNNLGHNKNSRRCPLHPQHTQTVNEQVEEVLNRRINEDGVIPIEPKNPKSRNQIQNLPPKRTIMTRSSSLGINSRTRSHFRNE